MGQLVAILKGITTIKEIIEKFYRAWVAFDVRTIRNNYEKKTKEQVEILEAIGRAKENKDDEAIKHLMRQYHTIGRVSDSGSKDSKSS